MPAGPTNWHGEELLLFFANPMGKKGIVKE
jgi:hypothetical protein